MSDTISPTTTGGSTATDFQPTNQNPQGNVNGSLQTGTPSSNLFNEPAVDVQTLPQTSSLQVASNNSTAVAPTSQPDTTPKAPTWGAFSLFFIAIVAVVVILIVIFKIAKPVIPTEKPVEQPAAVPVQAPKPKKKKKSKKRSNKKKR